MLLKVLALLLCTTVGARACDWSWVTSYYKGDSVAWYTFDQEHDVSVLIFQMRLFDPKPIPNPDVIVIGVDLDDEVGNFFLFDRNECFIKGFGSMSAQFLADMISAAGLADKFQPHAKGGSI